MPTPVSWLSNSQTNTGTADIPTARQSEITGLSNGNYLVSWVEDGTSGVATAFGQDIIGQLFDPLGNAIGGFLQLNTIVEDGDQDDFEVVATQDGGFLVAYRSAGGFNLLNMAVERFDDTGDTVGSANWFDTISTGGVTVNSSNPQIATNLATGAVTVVYERFNETTLANGDDDLTMRQFSSSLGLQSTTRIEDSFSDENSPAVAINTNGEIAAVFVEGGDTLELKVYNTSSAVQHSVVVATGLDDNADPRVVTLSNGNIAVSWAEDFGGGDYDIKTRVYNENLGTVSSVVTVADLGDPEDDVTMIALPQGGYVVAWETGGSTNPGLYAQVFTNTGTKDGSVATLAGFAISNAELGVTVDGRILYTYTQNNNIYHGIVDPRGDVIETAAQNGFDSSTDTTVTQPVNFVTGSVTTARLSGGTINGSAADEHLIGFAGDDTIVGGLGRDMIESGLGDDVIFANSFADIDAGGDNDSIVFVAQDLHVERTPTIDGGAGIDVLFLDDQVFGVWIDLENEFSDSVENPGGRNSLKGIEDVIGSGFADLLIGSSEDETLDGGAGNDTLNGGGGRDSLVGGTGDDLFVFDDGLFIDTVGGGANRDTLDLSALEGSEDKVTIDLSANTWSGRGGSAAITGIEVILGTQAFDSITGSAGADEINGNGGNDVISGGSSIDTLNGGSGNDTIRGGGSSDVMDGGDDIDTLLVDEFNGAYRIDLATGVTNFVETAINFENVVTGNGQDTIFGTADENVIRTNGGNDRIVSSSTDGDLFDAGDDNDTVVFEDAFDRSISVDLMAGEVQDGLNDTLATLISVENVEVNGSAQIIGDDQANRLIATGTGADDDNVMSGNGGNDTMDGGAGDDNLRGGDGDDSLVGGSGADILEGGADDDIVNGGAGNDSLQDSEDLFSTDVYDGGDNVDELSYVQEWSNFFIFDLSLGRQTNGLGSMLDQITNIENLKVNGAATLIGDGAANDLFANGSDASFGNLIEGRGGNDTLRGAGGNDTILGGADNDSIDGGAHADNLDGGDGADTIIGGDGADTIRGGAGADTMDGGDGVDLLLLDDLNSAYSLDLETGQTNVPGETAINFESVTTGGGNDTVQGSFEANVITTGGGNDRIIDTGSFSLDTYDGGVNIDTVVYTANWSSGVEFNLADGVSRITATGQQLDQLISIENLEVNGSARLTGSNQANVLIATGTSETHGNVIEGRNGDDTIEGRMGNDSLDGGTGRDSILGGDGDDTIRGGADADTMDGGDGVDTLLLDDLNSDFLYNMITGVRGANEDLALNFENVVTGSGDNAVVVSVEANDIQLGAGNDVIIDPNGALASGHYDGGGNIDTLRYTLFWGSAVTFDLTTGEQRAGTQIFDTFSDFENLEVEGSARLIGDGLANLLKGLGTDSGDGNVIDGAGGEDTIEGNGGNDSLSGGDDSDTVLGGTGNDTIHGGAGEDSLDGGVGVDTVDYSDLGADLLFNMVAGFTNLGAERAHNFEVVLAGDGNDSITGNAAENTIRAGAGDDLIVDEAFGVDLHDGGDDTDTVAFTALWAATSVISLLDGTSRLSAGGAVVDTFIGIENLTVNGSAQIVGDMQANVLIGSGSETDHGNLIAGKGGDDTIMGFGGDDTVQGNFGNDHLDGGNGADHLDGGGSRDSVLGGDGNDTLLGGDGADTLSGDAGQDSLLGGDGGDSLSAGLDADVLNGQRGNDTLYGGGQADTLQGGNGNDLLFGEFGADSLLGGNGNDLVVGGDGADEVVGGNGNDSLQGNAGNDILLGGSGADRLFGDDNADTLIAGFGNDLLSGGTGNDSLDGGGNNDLLRGGNGADTLIGNDGNDTLTGGNDDDVFVFGSDHGADVITDFSASDAERLDLRGTNEIFSFTDLITNHLDDVNGVAHITSDAGSIMLAGVAVAEISVNGPYSANDFIFV